MFGKLKSMVTRVWRFQICNQNIVKYTHHTKDFQPVCRQSFVSGSRENFLYLLNIYRLYRIYAITSLS